MGGKKVGIDQFAQRKAYVICVDQLHIYLLVLAPRAQSLDCYSVLNLLIFRAKVRKSSGEKQIYYYSQMGKEIVGQKNSVAAGAKTIKILKTKTNADCLERSKEKYVQFFEFLKKQHGSQSKQRPLEAAEEPLVKEIKSSVMRFFNQQKNYEPQELERYVIYLANLLNILKEQNQQLNFSNEFKKKIRKFLCCIVQAKRQGKSKNSKMQALLYILAILIYKERAKSDLPIQNINNAIYSDKILVRHILSLTLSKYQRMSKFYGVVMIYVSNQQNSMKLRQSMIKSIFTNLSMIDHEPTFFNLVLYLRSQKNRVKINYHDILDGQIFEIFLQAYTKYINKSQAYYMIDYLNHLLTLFPPLVSKIPSENFINRILISTLPSNLHYPFQGIATLSFLQSILKYADTNTKKIILHRISQFLLTIKHTNTKLVNLIVDYKVQQTRLMELLENGLFQSLLALIDQKSQEAMSKEVKEVCQKLINKLEGTNASICGYMKYQLKCRLRMIEQSRRINMAAQQANNRQN